MKRFKKIILGMSIVFICIQFIPLNRSNPQNIDMIDAPEPVQKIIQRACFDCHSNETQWPWYSYVAPISFLIVYDVHEGREHLNFSDWRNPDNEIDDIMEEIHDGEMPLLPYQWLHPESKLTHTDIQVLEKYFGDQDD